MSKSSTKKPTPDAEPGRSRSFKRRLLLSGVGILFALFLLGLVEVLLILIGVGKSPSQNDPFVGFQGSAPLFEAVETESGTLEYRTAPSKLAYFNQQSFPAEKGENSFRIFALGGSTTFGRPYDWRVAFPHWLQLQLQASDPGTEFQVINAGGVSYASYRVAVLMQELVAYEPDLFMVLTGHNEFLEERSYGDLRTSSPLQKVWRGTLSRTRTANLMRSLLVKPSAISQTSTLKTEVSAKLDVWNGMKAYRRDDLLKQQVSDHFRFNIRRMIRMAKDSGVPVIFVTPTSNVKDFSPFKSEHGANLTPSQREAFQDQFLKGKSLLEKGDVSGALAVLEAAVALDPRHAEGQFLLARALLKTGHLERAKTHFLAAKEEDVCPLRNLEAMNRILVQVTAEEKVPLVDWDSHLKALSQARGEGGLLGWETFLDHVHPRIEAHQELAELLFKTLADRAIIQTEKRLDQNQMDAIYKEAIGRLDRDYYAQRDLNLAKVLAWAGKTDEAEEALARSEGVLSKDERMHFNRGVIHERGGRYGEALVSYGRAVDLDPRFFEAQFNRGKVMQQLGDYAGAVVAFQKAVNLREDNPEALLNLGWTHFLAGDFQPALDPLARSVKLDPDFPGARLKLGRAYQEAGDLAKALAVLKTYRDDYPEEVAAHYYLGLAQGKSQLWEQARSSFTKAAALNPAFADAFRNLAQVHVATGNEEAAIQAFQKAMAADPEDVLPVYELALLHHRKQRLKEAVDFYRVALKLKGDFAEAHHRLGAALGQMGDYAGARQAFLESIKYNPKNTEGFDALAQIELYLGNPEKAAVFLKKAMALGFQPGKERLELLKPYMD